MDSGTSIPKMWNGSAAVLPGCSGRNSRAGTPAESPAAPPVIADILRRLTENEELHSYEARLRRKDGSIRHVLISSNVLRRDGEFIHTRCFTRDITERKRLE